MRKMTIMKELKMENQWICNKRGRKRAIVAAAAAAGVPGLSACADAVWWQ